MEHSETRGSIIGVDVGGTFTDLVMVDSASGTMRIAKTPTTLDNQAFGVLAALEQAEVDLADVGLIVHGTTTTTNAVLERKLALFALPGGAVRVLFAHRRLAPRRFERAQQVSSVFSLICLLFVLYLGFTGPRDPLSNLMPLGFWTLGWVAAVSLSGVFGNLWHWINP